MGQSATLYRIGQIGFDRLSEDPSKFNLAMTEAHTTFEQNFEGIIYLLSKLGSNGDQTLIHEIFYPSDSIGKTVDFNSSDFDINGDLSFLETESINYLSHEKVSAIKEFLSRVNKAELLDLYDPDELNDNGIYPSAWHSNESNNQAFNKRHIEDGFDHLVAFFNDAATNANRILSFVGY